MDTEYRTRNVYREQAGENRYPVPRNQPSYEVVRLMDQQFERQIMRMLPSQTQQKVKDFLQADLDAYRGEQTIRIASDLFAATLDAMSRDSAFAQQVIAEHPELAADIEHMLNEHLHFLSPISVVVRTGYLRRFYQLNGER